MELHQVKGIIESIIVEIGHYRKKIKETGNARAKALKNYDKQLAITLANLGHNDNYILSGKEYKQPPITLRKTIAKGICADFLEEKEIADSAYKAVIANIEALEAQLNGYQSIYRHADSI
jgi:hypothetical protein